MKLAQIKGKISLCMEAIISWGYHPNPAYDLFRAEVLCGQAFGFRGPKTADEADRIPGLPNQKLGNKIMDLREQIYSQTGALIPLCIQGEIRQSCALKVLDDNDVFLEVVHHWDYWGKKRRGEAPGYVGCYTIEYLTWQWMKINGWKRVLIVTHPLLTWRMKKVLEKLAANDGMEIEVIIPPGLEYIGYDSGSTQWRCRNVLSWFVYEQLARQHHIWQADWV